MRHSTYKLLQEKYEHVQEAKSLHNSGLAKRLWQYSEYLNPDTIWLNNGGYVLGWFKDFNGQTLFVIDKKSTGRTHVDIEYALDFNKLSKKIFNVYKARPSEKQFAGIQGRVGMIGDKQVIAFWQPIDQILPALKRTVWLIEKFIGRLEDDLVIIAGKTINYYNDLINATEVKPASKKELSQIALQRQYHQETDPIKKKQLAQKLGIIPQVPKKNKVQVTGDSVIPEGEDDDLLAGVDYLADIEQTKITLTNIVNKYKGQASRIDKSFRKNSDRSTDEVCVKFIAEVMQLLREKGWKPRPDKPDKGIDDTIKAEDTLWLWLYQVYHFRWADSLKDATNFIGGWEAAINELTDVFYMTLRNEFTYDP